MMRTRAASDCVALPTVAACRADAMAWFLIAAGTDRNEKHACCQQGEPPEQVRCHNWALPAIQRKRAADWLGTHGAVSAMMASEQNLSRCLQTPGIVSPRFQAKCSVE